MRLEIQELRVLAAVVEHNGFRRAADALHITQSAVSQALATLEGKLSMPLLQRKPLEPTEAGLRVLSFAQQHLREEALLQRDLADIRRGQAARLSLAVNSVINRYYAPQLLESYCDRQPFARLLVEEMPSRQIIQAVLAGHVELGMGPFQTHMPAFGKIPLYDEVRTLVVSKHHPLASQLRDQPDKVLHQVPLIASYVDEPQDRPASERIRDRFSRVWEVRSISLRLQLLAQGRGVGYVSDLVLAQEPRCADLQVLDKVDIARIPRTVGLFYRRDAQLSSAAQVFVALCRERWS